MVNGNDYQEVLFISWVTIRGSKYLRPPLRWFFKASAGCPPSKALLIAARLPVNVMRAQKAGIRSATSAYRLI